MSPASRFAGYAIAAALMGVVATAGQARADVVDLTQAGSGTSPGNWIATAEGVTGAAKNAGNYIALTTTANNDGTPIAGMTASNFDGYAVFSNNFYIPVGATNVRFSYSGLDADDRSALLLNGHVLAYEGINGIAGQAGHFVMTDGGQPVSVIYSGNTSNGVTADYFNVGGINTISIIANGTYAGYADCAGSPYCSANGLYTQDFKSVGFRSTSLQVSYDKAVVTSSPGTGDVPEPSGLLGVAVLALLGLAGGGIALRTAGRGLPAVA